MYGNKLVFKFRKNLLVYYLFICIVFDKRDKPRQVRFLGEQIADTKF